MKPLTIIPNPAFAIAAISFFVIPTSASAFVPGLSLTGGQNVTANNPWTLGWEFNVNRVINIDALGIFDSGVLGLNGTYGLGLWDLGGNLLASTTVAGAGDGIENGFVWKSLAASLKLTPGNYVVGAAGDYSGNGDLYAYDGSFTTLPGVTFISNKFILGSVLQYPSLSTSRIPAFLGGNFSESSEKAPSPLPVIGAAAAFGWTRRLRSRVRQLSRAVPKSHVPKAV